METNVVNFPPSHQLVSLGNDGIQQISTGLIAGSFDIPQKQLQSEPWSAFPAHSAAAFSWELSWSTVVWPWSSSLRSLDSGLHALFRRIAALAHLSSQLMGWGSGSQHWILSSQGASASSASLHGLPQQEDSFIVWPVGLGSTSTMWKHSPSHWLLLLVSVSQRKSHEWEWAFPPTMRYWASTNRWSILKYYTVNITHTHSLFLFIYSFDCITYQNIKTNKTLFSCCEISIFYFITKYE